MTDPGRTWRFSIEGWPSTSSGDEYFAVPAEVSREFFSTLGITRTDGRLFDMTDRTDSRAVVVMSEAAVRRYFRDRSPIGQRLRIAGLNRLFTLIGIVADVHQGKLQDDSAPALYVLIDQVPDIARTTTLIARTVSDPLPMSAAIRNAVRSVDVDMPIDDVRSMEVVRRMALGEPRFRTFMLASFAGLALVLGAIGLYGLLSQFIGEHSHDIGVRVALGATGQNVLGFVAGHTLKLVGVGLTAGVLVALSVARLVRGFLFNVSPTDTSSYVIAGVLFIVVAAIATCMPARRAARVDPMIALRAE